MPSLTPTSTAANPAPVSLGARLDTANHVRRMAQRMANRRPSPIQMMGDRVRGGIIIDVLVGVPDKRTSLATFPHILRGIQARAELEIRERPELGQIKVTIHYRSPGSFHPRSQRSASTGRSFSGDGHGMILIYPFDEAAVERISRSNMAVSVLETYEPLGIDSVDTDDNNAISSLVGYLHSAGHSRIGFVSWPYPVKGTWVKRRLAAFENSLRDSGLRFCGEWIINGLEEFPRIERTDIADAVAATIRKDGVTAWVCTADHQAYPLIRELGAKGVRVPHDCSVTGFDGLEPPSGLPRATSAKVPHEHVGSSALTRVINRVIYPFSPRKKILVQTQLVTGETVAAPRQS